MELLFYTAKLSSRLEYIASVLLPAAGINEYKITSDSSLFNSFNGAKINYSSEQISDGEVWVQPTSLLFESDISAQIIEVFDWKDSKAFFKTSGDIPFDIFAASFYLITRYEEYLPHSLDTYGRYAHDNSLAFKEGFLKQPLVNIWVKEFGKLLQQKFPFLHFEPTPFRFIATYDIDMAWSYRNKGLLRNVGGLLRSIRNSEWSAVKERLSVVSGKQKDPFDVYDWLDDLHNKCGIEPIYFFLLAKHNKLYDKNISPANLNFQSLIQSLASKYEVGIHPSWQSGDDVLLLDKEIVTLKNIINKKVDSSRQHYIRMKLPGTYRELIKAGIKRDFSMGYGSINGFRASYCLPYKWYDLEEEIVTDLVLYPFCFMEANSYYEQHYTLRQATEELDYYYNIVKDVNGVLITIWHNHILGNQQTFTGWKEMYERFIDHASGNAG